MVSKGQRSCDA